MDWHCMTCDKGYTDRTNPKSCPYCGSRDVLISVDDDQGRNALRGVGRKQVNGGNTPAIWTPDDDRRIRELRESTRARELTSDERQELRELRRREGIEAFRRRREMYKR